MLEEIIHQCNTGFGDCIVGFVSAYILKNILESRLKKNIRLSIKWPYVSCPYIRESYYEKGRLKRRERAIRDCRFSGADGTWAFRNYYSTPRMKYDIERKKYLIFLTNQYLGRCFINEEFSRDKIKKLTIEGYEYFWNEVIDHSKYKVSKQFNEIDFANTLLIHVRIGDSKVESTLIDNTEIIKDKLATFYKSIDKLNLDEYKHIILLGDVDNKIMVDTFTNIFKNAKDKIIKLDGNVSHSVNCRNNSSWNKIMEDLNLILKSKNVVLHTLFTNFVRIVLFLDKDKIVYDPNIKRVEDLSIIFAKHYKF